MHTRQLIEVAAEANRRLAAPHQPDDLDRLLQGPDRLAWSAPRAANRRDRIPETAGAEAELDPAVAQLVEGGGGLGQHGRGSQRQRGDVGKDREVPRAHRDRREQGPGVMEAGLVGMVLDPHVVEAELVGQHRELERLSRMCDRGQKVAEADGSPIVSHGLPLS
jgi:hypothetical protein